MDFTQYIPLTSRTFNYQEQQRDFEHVMLGIIDEIGELAGAIKKKVGYDKTLDITNIKEELGDLSYFLAQSLKQSVFPSPMELNVLKIADEIVTRKRIKRKNSRLFEDVVYLHKFANSLIYAIVNPLPEQQYFEMYSEAMLSMLDIISEVAATCNTTTSKILEGNIAKLKKRFPYKFDASKADEINRDRIKEAAIIKKHT